MASHSHCTELIAELKLMMSSHRSEELPVAHTYRSLLCSICEKNCIPLRHWQILSQTSAKGLEA